MKKIHVVSIAVSLVLIAGFFALKGNSVGDSDAAFEPVSSDLISKVPSNNVSLVGGTQVIEIRAKGGYQPRKSVAQAGIPTVIRMDTAGTFDCSAAVRIPSMNISTILPPSGSTDIDIGTPKPGTLQVLCSMGMYGLQIEFQG